MMAAAAEALPEDLHAPHRTLDLLGHEAAEREVLEAWTSGRMHHAWLISGQRGIGKATLAYRIARFVLAQGNIEAGARAAIEDAGPGLFGNDLPPPTPLHRPRWTCPKITPSCAAYPLADTATCGWSSGSIRTRAGNCSPSLPSIACVAWGLSCP